MPMPATYRQAGREWRAMLDDVREVTGLQTDNLAYTAIEGVLKTFRRRLTVRQALAFADVLPAIPRAIFVSGWQPEDAPVPFPARADLVAEVKALRPHHSLTPDNAIEAVARALWRLVRHDDLNRVLDRLPPDARAFWDVPGGDPEDLRARIV